MADNDFFTELNFFEKSLIKNL